VLRQKAGGASNRMISGCLGIARSTVADVIEHAEGYVFAIARARYKVGSMDELGEKQLWVLLFDLRRNAQRRRKKATTNNANDANKGRAA
jgi:hypothetical protein